MPGIALPVSVSALNAIRIIQHNSADDFLAAAYPTLIHQERSSNIILAHALQKANSAYALADREATVTLSSQSKLSSSSFPHSSSSFWLTAWSYKSSATSPTIDLILSCISSTLGDYPIFLWTPYLPATVSSTWLSPRIAGLAQYLRACVTPRRVFSVFGKTCLVKAFSKYWTEMTGIPTEPLPFYAAYYTFCTPQSFRAYDREIPVGHCIRQATQHDLDSVARLCKEFADDSVFFPLNIEKARIEARDIISRSQMWVYEAMGQIGSICAVTRNSSMVSAITKVYTTPKWRRRGFAEHLVRQVTQRLFESGKQMITLYVGYDNRAARVYDKVGFVGLSGQEKHEGVEDALELGFVGTDRGHW